MSPPSLPNRKRGAGVLVLAADTGRALFARRPQHMSEPGTWSFWGGKIEPGETARQAALREFKEETRYDGAVLRITLLYVYRGSNDFEYSNYLLVVPGEFVPSLNVETETFGWYDVFAPPEPWHYGVEALYEDRGAVAKINKIRRAVSSGASPSARA